MPCFLGGLDVKAGDFDPVPILSWLPFRQIHGLAVACQTAEEMLRDLVSTICTKTITIRAPGVTRFFLEEESKNMMEKMETRFEVYIIVKQRPWKPLPQQVALLLRAGLAPRLIHQPVIYLDGLTLVHCTAPQAQFPTRLCINEKHRCHCLGGSLPAGCFHSTVRASPSAAPAAGFKWCWQPAFTNH